MRVIRMQMIKSSIWLWLYRWGMVWCGAVCNICISYIYISSSSSATFNVDAINIIVIARFDHIGIVWSKQHHRYRPNRDGNAREDQQCLQEKKSLAFTCMWTTSPVCIVLLSILIHLFANTIPNIVIHVIHLSTQILRFFLLLSLP